MSIADRPVGDFLEAVASGTATPGGGAVAAVSGAAGAALGEMVCANTDADDGALAEARGELAASRTRLLALADDDVGAVADLMDAYGDGDDAVQAASERAAEVPLAVAEACLAVLRSAAVAVERGNPNAAPDGVVGAYLAHAALRASVYTVEVNLPGVEDETFVERTAERSAELQQAGDEAFGRVGAAVDDGG